MKPWQLSTKNLPQHQRALAWQDAMNRLCLPVSELVPVDDFSGEVSCQVSPLGMEFSVVEADAMEFCGVRKDQEKAIWLSVFVAGQGYAVIDGEDIQLRRGDILYGPTGRPATLVFEGRFRQLFVRAPRLTVNPRVMVPMSLSIGRMPTGEGVVKVFSGMMLALADVLPEIKSHQLRPLEMAVTEFLMTGLEAEKSAFGLGGVEAIKASHLHRICQDIETRLAEPELSLSAVAQMSGVSTRYLQKLFQSNGRSFSSYVRTRRLERCKADLGSPLHAKLSISEISYRWGFNGSAHFSRIFRSEYGESPREYRCRVSNDSGAADSAYNQGHPRRSARNAAHHLENAP